MFLWRDLKYLPILDMLYQTLSPPIHRFDKTMVIQIAKIGNNLNQIARHANTHKTIDGIVLKQILDVNKKLDDLISQKLIREVKHVSKIL